MKATNKEVRKFAITLAIILTIVGGLQFWRGRVSVFISLISITVSLLILAVWIPVALRPLFFLFTKVSRAIGWFNTRLLLGITYYILFTPIGLFMRLLGKDLIQRKIDQKLKTYWIAKEEVSDDIVRYEKQF